MNIKEYIKESVRQVIREDVERQAIREIVKNELRKMYNEGTLDKMGMYNKKEIGNRIYPDNDTDSARHVFGAKSEPNLSDDEKKKLSQNADAIRNFIKSKIQEMYNEGVFEGGKPEDNKKDNDKEKETDATATGIGQLKAFFKDNPMIKKSQVAYEVLDGVDPDSARHIYNDILDQKDPAPKGFVNNSFDAIRNGIGGK